MKAGLELKPGRKCIDFPTRTESTLLVSHLALVWGIQIRVNRPDKQAFLVAWDIANRNDPPPRVRDVFMVNENDLYSTHRGQRFNDYSRRHGSHWETAVHGSTRECNIGNRQLGVKDGHLVCCDSETCGICGIIRKSFKIDRSKRQYIPS